MVHYSERLLTFIKAAEQATQQAKAHALREVGTTVAQAVVLTVLDEFDGLTAAELARRCQVTAQTMNSTIGRMEGHGLITRNRHPLHGTLIEIHLSDRGRELFARANAQLNALDRRLAADLTQHEVGQLTALLARITTTAREINQEATHVPSP